MPTLITTNGADVTLLEQKFAKGFKELFSSGIEEYDFSGLYWKDSATVTFQFFTPCCTSSCARSISINKRWNRTKGRALFPTKDKKVGRQPDDSPIWWFVRGAFVLEAGLFFFAFQIW